MIVAILVVFALAILLAFAGGVFASYLYHRMTVGDLEARIQQLDSERRLFLDHLARAGFGAPIFPVVSQEIPTAPKEEEAEQPETPQDKERRWLGEVAHRPGRLMARVNALMRKRFREQPRVSLTEQQMKDAWKDIDEVESSEVR